jgi:methylmalonyl-CoA/ethylmalonyl-CoA epimerase
METKTGPIKEFMRLHHVGIAVKSIAKQAEQYHQTFGIALTSEIIEDEIQKVRVAFAQVGEDVFVEFVEPLNDDSPVMRLLKQGGGLYHVCYLVPDLQAAIEQVRQEGGLLISGPSPARAFGGRHIAWVYGPDRSLVEFLEE